MKKATLEVALIKDPYWGQRYTRGLNLPVFLQKTKIIASASWQKSESDFFSPLWIKNEVREDGRNLNSSEEISMVWLEVMLMGILSCSTWAINHERFSEVSIQSLLQLLVKNWITKFAFMLKTSSIK